MNGDGVQRWVNGFLAEGPAPGGPAARAALPGVAERSTPRRSGIAFSPFIPEHSVQARELSRQLTAIAREDGLDAVEQSAEQMAAEHDPAMVRFAVKLFVTHSPQGRQLHIPALERRAPLKVVPSPPPPPRRGAVAAVAAEDLLNWWREDPEANEHHDHWHAVYPTAGIADPTPDDPNRTRLLDRQGELFFYMHQQMLARYDHERVAVGLPLVEPLADYDAAIPDGYDPAAGLRGFPGAWDDDVFPTPRPDDAQMAGALQFDPNQPPIPRSVLSTWHARLAEAATTGQLINANGDKFATGIDELGHATEPSTPRGISLDLSRVPDFQTYGVVHGYGHVFIAYSQGDPPGVMVDTDTAIRDPVFYRWHRHIDDLGFAWQQTQPPHDLSADAGGVELRHGTRTSLDRPAESVDLILIEETEQLAGLDADQQRSQLETDLGGTHWDDSFADTDAGTDELKTQMLSRTLTLEPVADEVRDIPYLDQRPFLYAVRMRNTQQRDHDVTVRVFFVADQLFASRRMWIELDKFKHRVTGEHSIAIRHASESAVVRKPGQKPPGPTRHSPAPAGEWDADSYCDCGWPYNLLLPRSTRRGLKFWLAAIITDWETDQVQSSVCGSMSFCGAKNAYPDKKSMGYPFDRPISGRAIAKALSERPNMAARSFRIRRLPDG